MRAGLLSLRDAFCSLRRLTWLSAALLLSGLSHAQTADYFARDSFRIDNLVCPFKGNIDYEPGDIECGLLQVPENRENPNSRYIELHFIKLN
ncbi:MAG: hypothetical protein WBM64_06340, partial [Woeseiaceae bacterium]